MACSGEAIKVPYYVRVFYVFILPAKTDIHLRPLAQQ
jgi:hypothetical protein